MKNTKAKIIAILVVLIVIFGGILAILKLNKNNDVAVEMLNTPTTQTVSIVSPSGAPALSLIGLIEDSTIELSYEIVDGADVLTSEFTKAEKDLIIAPINLGNKLITNGAEYKMLGVVTWGNLYIAASDNYFSKIAAFGEAAVPGKILNYIKDELGDIDIEYYNSVQEASSMLLSGEYKAALLAEPALTLAKMKYENEHEGKELKIIHDIQKLYKEKTGYDSYPQAAIFVKNDSIKKYQDTILNAVNKIRTAISIYNSNPEFLKDLKNVDFERLGFKNIDLVVSAYPKMALKFVYANECISEVKNFLDIFDMEYLEQNYIK